MKLSLQWPCVFVWTPYSSFLYLPCASGIGLVVAAAAVAVTSAVVVVVVAAAVVVVVVVVAVIVVAVVWCCVLVVVVQELNVMQAHKDSAQEMRQRHHSATQDVEEKHLMAMQSLRLTQLEKQHTEELSNQTEYNKRSERELQRKHMLEIKQQPKSLKVRRDHNKHIAQ